MGIAGLHSLLRPIITRRPIAAYRGARVGIDGHAWLHQLLTAVAVDLYHGRGAQRLTGAFLAKAETLCAHKIVPVFVFDGDALAPKAATNQARAALRAKHAREAAFYLARGDTARAQDYMKRCAAITPRILADVLAALRTRQLEYIISPYEADAQLTFLQRTGYIHYVLSEDSDLVPYGCQRVLYKYASGTVDEYDAAHLPRARGPFFAANILDICILSGCDYVPSVRGVGLSVAHKKLELHGSIRAVVEDLRRSAKEVPEDYLAAFASAKLTFLHHIIYDPRAGARAHLYPPLVDCSFLGTLETLPLRLVDSETNCEILVPRHFIPGVSAVCVAAVTRPLVTSASALASAPTIVSAHATATSASASPPDTPESQPQSTDKEPPLATTPITDSESLHSTAQPRK